MTQSGMSQGNMTPASATAASMPQGGMIQGGMIQGGMAQGGMVQGGGTSGGAAGGDPRLGAPTKGVILAENDGPMRAVIRSILLRAEQLVFPAADGEEAVMLARQFRARLVMLDIAMPRLNGLLACKAIRALPGYAAVPIVMLTGHCDDAMRVAAQRLGANDFITKPFRPNDLLARLATHLDLPAHLVPAVDLGEGDVMSGARVQVWKSHQDAKPTVAENAQLAEGREMMRVYRKVERHD
jgi:DNA-binding response OmpR family regulator